MKIFSFLLLLMVAGCAPAFAGLENSLLNPDWWKSALEITSAVVASASIIANKTKTDVDNKAVGIVSNIVNFLAGNFFRVSGKF